MSHSPQLSHFPLIEPPGFILWFKKINRISCHTKLPVYIGYENHVFYFDNFQRRYMWTKFDMIFHLVAFRNMTLIHYILKDAWVPFVLDI